MEVGPGQVLCNLILDIFEHADCINTCIKGDEPAALRRGLAALYALGHIDLPAESVELPDRQRPASPPAEAVAAVVTGKQPAGGVLEEVIAIIMAVYLSLNLVVAVVIGIVNARVTRAPP